MSRTKLNQRRRLAWRKTAGLPGAGLFALLLLAVAVPSACLLWFMTQAMRNERLAAQQQLSEAYRGHLTLARERLALSLKDVIARLDRIAREKSPSEAFAESIKSNLTDSAVIFDASNKLIYPDILLNQMTSATSSRELVRAEKAEAENPAQAAEIFAMVAKQSLSPNDRGLALRGKSRCLMQLGKKVEAIQILQTLIGSPEFQETRDEQNRLVVLNAKLTLLEALGAEDPPQSARMQGELSRRLCDYSGTAMPSAQRTFLMRQLTERKPDAAIERLLRAESLAAGCAEAGFDLRGGDALRPTHRPGFWQLRPASGRIIGLYSTQSLIDGLLASASSALPKNVRLELLPPGSKGDRNAWTANASEVMPDWELSLRLVDDHPGPEGAGRRVSSYVWIGLATIAFVLLISLLAAGLLRHQLALARLRNDLVANVTHELKTPLASTRLLVDTLLKTSDINSQTAREYLALIAGENARLSRLIDNFLTFSRIERNKTAFQFELVPVEDLVKKSIAAMSGRLSAPGCRFLADLAPDLPGVVADADAVVTAIINLLDNALKYTGEEKIIRLGATSEAGMVLISVKDNGIGISTSNARRIFRRYYQVNGTASAHTGGCGLGLSIVEFIAQAHGGGIQVVSAPGRGSEFVLSIPCANAAVRPAANENDSPKIPVAAHHTSPS